MKGVLHVRVNKGVVRCAHLLQQAAKGPTDRATGFALAHTGRITKKVHQLWEGHQTLYHSVGKTGIAQVAQTHKALQGGTVSMRHSQQVAQSAYGTVSMCGTVSMWHSQHYIT